MLFSGSHYSVLAGYSEKDGKFFLYDEPELFEGDAPTVFEGETRFNVALFSFAGEELYLLYFDVQTFVWDAADPSWFDKDGNQVVIPTARVFDEPGVTMVNFPYFSEAAKAVFRSSSDNSTLLEVDLSKKASCNQNGACDYLRGENTKNCGADCKDSSQDLPIVPVEKPAIPLIVPIVVVMLIAAAAYFYWKKARKRV